MPRNRRGGPREGTPGKAYPQRSDLNERRTLPASAAPGQTYGKAAAQVESQKQVPMASGPLPGSVTPLDAPTSRPGEPVTAGIPLGPGPGPEVLTNPVGGADPVLDRLRALYLQFPTEHIRRLIEDYD